MKLTKLVRGNPQGWKDTLTVELSGWELQVLVNSMAYIDNTFPCLDEIELGFAEEDAEALRNALDEIDEATSVTFETTS